VDKHPDAGAMVILWPELLASFQAEVQDVYNGGRSCHHHIINARLASGPATPFLIKLPFSEGGLSYGIL
jgi:hypothetical protein